MKYVLGIDQGGTKTHAMIADENGNVLGLAQSGGACHSTQGLSVSMNMVEEAVEAALKQSGITLSQISAVTAGMTGLDWKEEKVLLTQALQKLFPAQSIQVVNDCIIAMRAGTHKKRCCVLCAGTGLNCAIRKDDTQEFIYGFYISEEHQGGYALGKKTLQKIFDAEVGLQPPTLLTEMLLEFFQVADVTTLLKRTVTGGIDTGKKTEIPLLLEQAAEKNDMLALHILEEYGRSIARYVIGGLKRFDMLSEEIEVILSGSIFKLKLPVLLDALSAEIHRFAVHAKIINCRYEPIVGAVLMALEQLPKPFSPQIYENIDAAKSKFRIER